jgi:hypothetical protein
MTVSAELSAVIEAEVSALTTDKYRRPPSSLDDFLAEYGENLAQADSDKAKLVGAKFDWAKMEKFRGYFELLTIAHGQRVGLAPATVEKQPEYIAKMDVVKSDRRYLARIAGHIVDVSNDKSAAHTYHAINKGSGDIDTLNDIMAFVPFIKRFPEYSKQICPNGKEISDSYMEEAIARAIELFQMRGYVINKGVPENVNVDRQNRLLTLCLNAQSEIKKFADSAFCEDPEYYDSHYASAVRKTVKAAPAVEPVATK